ncbi:MAG: hypothetical protein IKU34_04600 [Clostridia bacterium]|nr:hypothetical protein [Clostridia bacterium]
MIAKPFPSLSKGAGAKTVSVILRRWRFLCSAEKCTEAFHAFAEDAVPAEHFGCEAGGACFFIIGGGMIHIPF